MCGIGNQTEFLKCCSAKQVSIIWTEHDGAGGLSISNMKPRNANRQPYLPAVTKCEVLLSSGPHTDALAQQGIRQHRVSGARVYQDLNPLSGPAVPVTDTNSLCKCPHGPGPPRHYVPGNSCSNSPVAMLTTITTHPTASARVFFPLGPPSHFSKVAGTG